jgi:uncharacterized SAM-binding protein YcdF (DUF218 family)
MESESTERVGGGGLRWARRPGWMIAGLVGALVLAGVLLRGPILSATASFLHVGEEPVPADVIFLLGGDIHARPEGAAELYRNGFAPRIVLTRVRESLATRSGAMPNETDATARFLEYLGVPDTSIVVLRPPDGAASTTEEAVMLREYLLRNPAERVLVVTSDFHTRRARWNLTRQLRGVPVEVRMVGVPDPRFDERDWWRNEHGMVAYFAEYVKFVHNRLYR